MVNRTRTSCYFSWKRCCLVFSYHGELSRFQVSKYIEYSVSAQGAYHCTCNIKSLFNVPKISHISRKISQVSQFPAKSPDSRNKFVFLPKQPLLELSPPIIFTTVNSLMPIATTSCKQPPPLSDHFQSNSFVSQSNTFSKTPLQATTT